MLSISSLVSFSDLSLSAGEMKKMLGWGSPVALAFYGWKVMKFWSRTTSLSLTKATAGVLDMLERLEIPST